MKSISVCSKTCTARMMGVALLVFVAACSTSQLQQASPSPSIVMTRDVVSTTTAGPTASVSAAGGQTPTARFFARRITLYG